MRGRLVAAFVLGLLTLGAEFQKPVRGAFAVLHFEPKPADLTAARNAGLNLVILQYTRAGSGTLDLNAVRRFIDNCETANLDYMLGLYFHNEWEDVPAALPSYVKNSTDLIDVLKDETKNDPRFKGWYFPLEFANNLDGATYTRIAREFAKVANYTTTPVAIAAYFNPYYDDAKTFAPNLAKVVQPFDVVLLQDSVGERTITNFKDELEPYYREVQDAAAPEMWAIVEGFQCAGVTANRQCVKPRTVAPARRICDQVATARTFTKDVVAYDLIEFLAPRGTPQERAAFRAFARSAQGRRCPP